MVLSVIDYGLGLTTTAQINLPNLDRLQTEAIRVILGCTKDTPTEIMRFLLDLPSKPRCGKSRQADSSISIRYSYQKTWEDTVCCGIYRRRAYIVAGDNMCRRSRHIIFLFIFYCRQSSEQKNKLRDDDDDDVYIMIIDIFIETY